MLEVNKKKKSLQQEVQEVLYVLYIWRMVLCLCKTIDFYVQFLVFH